MTTKRHEAMETGTGLEECVSLVEGDGSLRTVKLMSNPQPVVSGPGYDRPNVTKDAAGNNFYLATMNYGERPGSDDKFYHLYAKAFLDHQPIQQCVPDEWAHGYYDPLTRSWYVESVVVSSTSFDGEISPTAAAAPHALGGPLSTGELTKTWRPAGASETGQRNFGLEQFCRCRPI